MTSFRRLLCLMAAAVLLPALVLAARAEDYTARLDSLDFDIRLLEDGSAQITETRVVTFSGDHEFTRYGVSNLFTGPRVFRDWQVLMDGGALSMLEAPDNENRPENTFAVETGEGENTLFVYHRSREVTRTFQIRYRVENAVKRYEDIGDFHWNLTGETGISSIALVTATVTVPEGIAEADFRIWAHGPLNGTFEKRDAASACLRVEYVPYGTIVDLRTVFPAEVLTGGWDQEGTALEAILEEETALADSANARREELAREQAETDAYWEAYWAERDAWEERHPILTWLEDVCLEIYFFFCFDIQDQLPALTGGASFLVFACTILFGRTRANPKKLRRTPSRLPKYCRSLPDRRSAPTVDRLLHFYGGDGKADPIREISAAMLELDLKKRLRFRSLGDDTQILLAGSAARAQYQAPRTDSVCHFQMHQEGGQAVFQTNVPPREDPDYRDLVWDFLAEAAQGTGGIRVSELKDYVSRNQQAAWQLRSDFESAVLREFSQTTGTQYLQIHPLTRPRRLFLIPVGVGVLSFLVRGLSNLYDGFAFGSAVLVGLIAMAVSALPAAAFCLGGKLSGRKALVLDQQAEDARALWQAFGRFLEDFTTFERKDLPEFPVWRDYMVYAVAMGKGKTVARALAAKYPEALGSSGGFYDEDYRRWLEDPALYDALDSVSRDLVTAQPPRAASSSSDDSWSDNWSDGSGSGGGFSDSGGGSDSGSGGDFAD